MNIRKGYITAITEQKCVHCGYEISTWDFRTMIDEGFVTLRQVHNASSDTGPCEEYECPACNEMTPLLHKTIQVKSRAGRKFLDKVADIMEQIESGGAPEGAVPLEDIPRKRRLDN